MEKIYIQKLSELKPLLPKGYQELIGEMCPDVKIWQIKFAFSGRSVKQDILLKIVNAAAEIADNYVNAALEVRKSVDKVLDKAKAI